MRYLSHTDVEIADMLKVIGKPSLNSLFSTIPNEARLKRPLALPPGASEIELKTLLLERTQHVPSLSFLGAGATAHFVPEIVSQLLLRGEWYTAYTPYQPEASQGTLQAIFEYQTMVANLYGCDIANASMYDGATATCEALLMALRLKSGRKKVLWSRAVHPEYREVCATHLKAAHFEFVEIPVETNGCTDLVQLKNLLASKDVAAVLYQTPNFFGQLENQRSLIDMAHDHDALAVVANAEPVLFSVAKSPGQYGADIVAGEGLGLCGHLSLGGPGVGLFATSQQFLRQMPGRLCGQTVDATGKRGFVLTLSTREQHIRRERATSNICTNHNLMALAFTITMSLYGKQGFIELGQRNVQRALYFREKALAAGLKLAFYGSHFNEAVIQFDSEAEATEKLEALAAKNIFAGVKLSRWYPEYKGAVLVATTELHRQEDIDQLVQSFGRQK